MRRFFNFVLHVLFLRLADGLSVSVAPTSPISRPVGSPLLLTCSLNLTPTEVVSSIQLTRTRSRNLNEVTLRLEDYAPVANSSAFLARSDPTDRNRRVKRQTANSVTIGWFKQTNSQERIGSASNERYYVELDAAMKKLKLIFTQLRDTDTGNYVCSAKSNAKTTEAKVTITVTQPTQITNCETNQDVKLNDKSSIICEAQGSPSPIRTWSKLTSANTYDFLGRFVSSQTRTTTNTATVTQNGLDIDKVSLSDAGRYEIRFEIEAIGDIQIRYVDVRVTVPPSIEQTFVDPNSLQNGETELRCDVSGTPAPIVRWFRKEDLAKELNSQLSRRYEVIGDGSRLKISSLQPNDTGEYVCTANSNAGSATASMALEVKTIPEIVRLPSYQTSLANKSVEIRCIASGSAPLDVRIYKYDDEQDTMIDMSQSLMMDSRINVQTSLPPGNDEPYCDVRKRYCKQQVVTIGLSRPSDTANYTCIARNDAGSANRSSLLEIFYGPFINKNVTKVYGYDDIPANLTCIVYGKPVPEFLWQKVDRPPTNIANISFINSLSNQQRINMFKDSRYYRIYMQYFPRHTVSTLEISVLKAREDYALAGSYRCMVTGRSGDVADSHTIDFGIGGPPKAPISCSIALSTASYVRLRIEPPSETGGFPLLGYSVNFRLRDADGSLSATSSDPTSFKIGELVEIRGLRPQTEYRFLVAAKNRIGAGAQTECVHVTPEVSPPGPPEITSPTKSTSPVSYELTWTLDNDGGLPISQYTVRIRKLINGTTPNGGYFNRIAPPGSNSTVIDSLDPATTYELELCAINTQGASLPSVLRFQTLPRANVSVAEVKEQMTILSRWITISIIAGCALIATVAIDVTCYYWKACGFIHTFCIMCCSRDKRQVKTQYNFEAAERRYLMTLERSKEHSRVTTPLAGVSPSVERKDSAFAPQNVLVHNNNSVKPTELLVIERHGDVGTIAVPHDANNNNNNGALDGFAAAQIHAAPVHSTGNGNALAGNNYYA